MSLPFYMIRDLKLSQVNTFGIVTLQSIAIFLNVKGWREMDAERLITAIQEFPLAIETLAELVEY